MAGADGGPDGGGPGRRWDVALSFAGAQREFAEQVARALAARGVRCFYDFDPHTEVELWGKHLAEHLTSVYGQQAGVVVVFVSAEYVRREWTRLEHRAALSRAMRENREYVLPVRFDDAELPGLLPDVAVIDLRTRPRSPEELAGLIIQKLDALGITTPTLAADPAGGAPEAADREHELARLQHLLTRVTSHDTRQKRELQNAVEEAARRLEESRDAEASLQPATWQQVIARDRTPETQGFVSPGSMNWAGVIAWLLLPAWTVLVP